MPLDSPFHLWIPGSLDRAGTREFLEKQIAINSMVKQAISGNVNFWEAMELIESAYSGVEVDKFIDRLDVVAEYQEPASRSG